MGIALASATNTLIKGFIIVVIAGWKEGIKLLVNLTGGVIPGILAEMYLIM